jgi:acetoacetyl-CoA synthetase
MTVTGAVLTAPLMEWVHEAFGKKLHIGSSSGGTDIFGASRFLTTLLRAYADTPQWLQAC